MNARTALWSILTVLLLVLVLMTVALSVNATCDPNDTGTPADDIINCTVANPPSTEVAGGGGNDTIVIDSGVNVSLNIGGDFTDSTTGSGDDTIINNGLMNSDILGDSNFGSGNGDDVIVNNGTVNEIFGDSSFGDGFGGDTIVNNGGVVGDVYADTSSGNGSGSDSVTNNGVVQGNVFGDSEVGSGAGNDTITNNGTVTGIYGDDTSGSGTGSDTIVNSGTVTGNIVAGGGNDTVTIQGTGSVGGVMDGGAGFDILTFDVSTNDPDELLAIAEQIAAANPTGGTLVIQGRTYVWQNFEQLSAILLSLVRINRVADPVAVFCRLGGGIDVYAISGTQGVFSTFASAQALSSALAQASTLNSPVAVSSSSTSTVFALPSGEVQVNTPSGFAYTFNYQTRCGTLPAPQAFVPEEEIVESGVIINRPR
jgi:hypothetical protein